MARRRLFWEGKKKSKKTDRGRATLRDGSPADTWLSFDARVIFSLVHPELKAAKR